MTDYLDLPTESATENQKQGGISDSQIPQLRRGPVTARHTDATLF